MAKPMAGALDALSPNEPSLGARRSTRRAPVPDWFQGKENENHRDSNTPIKSVLKNSDIRALEVSSRKQNRLGDDADPPAARKRIKRSPEEYGLPGSGNSTLSKGNVSAERPRGAQLAKVVLGNGNCTGTPLRDENDAAEPACGYSRCPDSLHCGLIYGSRTNARTSKGAFPTGPISGKKDLGKNAKGSRNLDSSGVEHVEVRNESTREGDGSSENEVGQERKGNVADNPATTKGNEGGVLSVKANGGCKGQGVIDHSGNKNRCLEDGSVELTAARHHSSRLEESIGKKSQVPLENASQYKSRVNGTSSETKNNSEKMNDRDSVERERTHGVTTGILQGSERCPSCCGVGLSFVDGEAAVQVLQEAYNKLYKKYQRAKTRKLTDVKALYDEQTRKFAAFSTAADALVWKLREENNFLTRQLEETNVQECITRSRLLEEELIECRNDFVMERCKVLELEQELREAQVCIMELKTACSTVSPNSISTSVVPEQQSCDLEATHDVKLRTENAVQLQSFEMGSPSAQIGGKHEIMKNTLPAVDSTEKETSAEGVLQRAQGTDVEVCARQSESGQLKTGPGVRKLLHALLQNLTQMTPVVDGDSSHIMFIHEESGFKFRLVQNEHSQAVGGDDALLYQVMEPGTLLHLVPEWMQSEFVFDITQTNVLFQRILTLAFGGRLI